MRSELGFRIGIGNGKNNTIYAGRYAVYHILTYYTVNLRCNKFQRTKKRVQCIESSLHKNAFIIPRA